MPENWDPSLHRRRLRDELRQARHEAAQLRNVPPRDPQFTGRTRLLCVGTYLDSGDTGVSEENFAPAEKQKRQLIRLLLRIARLVTALRAALLPATRLDSPRDRVSCGRMRLAAPRVPRAPGLFPSRLKRQEWGGSMMCFSGEAQAV